MVSVAKVILLRASIGRALFRVLSPPRSSQFRTVLPEEAGIGLAPAREATAASEWACPRWAQAVRQTAAAVTGPNPVSCSRGRGFAELDQSGDPGAVDLELCAEFGVALGQPDCHGAGNGQGQRFFPGMPAGDVGDRGPVKVHARPGRGR